MKYIILPPFKLLWALFLTIAVTPLIILYFIGGFIWHLKAPTFGFFADPIFNISPYWKRDANRSSYLREDYFYSMYHYIWGFYQ